MKTFYSLGVILLILNMAVTRVHARVHLHVINRLGNGRVLNVHCQSSDDDLGYQSLEDGSETTWSFSINFWGTTLFFCDVQWDGLVWYHFDAFDAVRDHGRCRSECRWMINRDGLLFGYVPQDGLWDMFPMTPV
ncbi:hypothetical protein RJ639_017407 [Escallonia herrerae]|uniref:S-protein homolog n=1 Tax=Escallonia herrerae TaxID=1293975 RepID=A0AA88VDC8_9ASTE|nr:hypothetical protein RJ639_017407 [Escallonia herrerae]